MDYGFITSAFAYFIQCLNIAYPRWREINALLISFTGVFAALEHFFVTLVEDIRHGWFAPREFIFNNTHFGAVKWAWLKKLTNCDK
jgi:hypothetical protein